MSGCLTLPLQALLGLLRLLVQQLAWIFALIRLLGQQVLRPLMSYFPDFGRTLLELGKRSLLLARRGAPYLPEMEEMVSFVPPSAARGIVISDWALAEFGVGATVITVLVLVGYLIYSVAPPVLGFLEYLRNEAAYRALVSQADREILERDGAYRGMPLDLGRNWVPDQGAQERLNRVLDDIVADPTRGGPGKDGLDPLRSLIGAKSNQQQSTLPSSGHSSTATSNSPLSGEVGSVERSNNSSVFQSPGAAVNAASRLDEAALQGERLRALSDFSKYNQLVQEHRALYQKYGVDPCKSGFAVQDLCRQ